MSSSPDNKAENVSQKPETLNDFERIANALDNPKAEPYEYCVRSYGYCNNCCNVTAYKSESGPEGGWMKCLVCRKFCSWGSWVQTIGNDIAYATGDMVPVRYQDTVERRNGRDFQRKIFLELLRSRVAQSGFAVGTCLRELERARREHDEFQELFQQTNKKLRRLKGGVCYKL